MFKRRKSLEKNEKGGKIKHLGGDEH